MLRTLSRSLDRLYLLSGWLAGAMLVLLLALVCYNIIARMIGVYSGGTTEYSGYVMAAGTFLGLAYTFRSAGHIRVNLLIERTGGATKRVLEILTTGVMAAAITFLAFYSITLVLDSLHYNEVSDGADATPLWIVQIPMAVGASIFAISTIHGFILACGGYDPTASEIVRAGEVQEI